MKKSLLIILGILAALPAICQIEIKGILEPTRPFVEGVTGAVWNQKVRVEVRNNTYYKYVLETPTDTVRHFMPMDGKKYEVIMTFKAVGGGGIDTLTADNEGFNFTPTGSSAINSVNANGWSHFDYDMPNNPDWCKNFYMGSCSFSQSAGSVMVYQFTGKRIEIWGEKGTNKGIAGFKIDETTEQIKDLYLPGGDNQRGMLFEADFPQGVHKITIRVTGNKNPSATFAYVLVDKAVIYSDR